MNTTLVRLRFAILGLLLVACGAQAQGIGRVEFATGIARIERGTQMIAAVRGTEVIEGDTVVTGPDTQVQLRMVDDAFLALRPNSRLALDRYRSASARGGEDGVVLALAHGILRTFTGAIAARNRDRFVMKTPLATVGIRGSGNILAHLGFEGTVNHTISGEHSITALDVDGRLITLVTKPGQTVQVLPGAPPRYIPTPAYIFAAASSAPNAPAQAANTADNTVSAGTSSSSGPTTGSSGGGDSGGSSSSSSSSSSSVSSASSASSSSSPASPASSASSASSSSASSFSSSASSASSASSPPSSAAQQVQSQPNFRGTGNTVGPGIDGPLGAYVASSFPNPFGGRFGIFAYDEEAGTATAQLDASGFLTRAGNLKFINILQGPADPPDANPGDLTSATVQIAGGTPFDYFRNIEQTILLGRWDGASVTVTGVDCSCGATTTRTAGTPGLAYVVYSPTPLGIMHSLTGTTEFRLDGATRPTDAAGHVGTLNSARMSANFSSFLLDFAFNLTVNNLTYDATATGIYFDRVQFQARSDEANSATSAVRVTCGGAGCASRYRAWVDGAFAGNDAAAAWMGYQITPERAAGAAYSDVVTGNFALTAVTRPAVGIVLPATGAMNFALIDNYTSAAPGFPAFTTTASAHADFTNRRADFTMTLNRVLTPADIAAGFQSQSVTASASNLPIVGVLFTARTSDSTLHVTCTGCGTAAPAGRFDTYFSYVAPSQRDVDLNMYWYLANGMTGTLGYDYQGSSYFANTDFTPAAAALSSAAPRLARLPANVLRPGAPATRTR